MEIIEKKNRLLLRLDTRTQFNVLQQVFSVAHPQAALLKRRKQWLAKNWNGRVNFLAPKEYDPISKEATLPIGFLPRLLAYLAEEDISYQFEKRIQLDPIPFGQHLLLDDGSPLVLDSTQTEATKALLAYRRAAVELGTGSGKTECVLDAFACVQQLYPDVKMLFVVPTLVLLSQTILRTKHRLPWLRNIGVLGEGKFDVNAQLVIGTNATASGDERLLNSAAIREYLQTVDILAIDECFPAGTIVDGRPIETYQKGDKLRGFDERRGQIIDQQVTRVFKRKSDSLIRVRFANGASQVCTACHPFATMQNGQIGYATAPQLFACGGSALSIRDEDLCVHSLSATIPTKKRQAAVPRICGPYWTKTRRAWFSTELFSRYCPPIVKNWGRSRRFFPHNNFTAATGSKENTILDPLRVVSCEVLELGDYSKSSEMSGAFVYNLEVEESHNYFISVGNADVLVHNCHHSKSFRGKALIDLCPSTWLWAVSAKLTFFDKKNIIKHWTLEGLFGKPVYQGRSESRTCPTTIVTHVNKEWQGLLDDLGLYAAMVNGLPLRYKFMPQEEWQQGVWRGPDQDGQIDFGADPDLFKLVKRNGRECWVVDKTKFGIYRQLDEGWEQIDPPRHLVVYWNTHDMGIAYFAPRNKWAVNLALAARKNHEPFAIAVKRSRHCHHLYKMLLKAGLHVEMVTGALSGQEQLDLFAKVTRNEVDGVISMYSILAEGVDIPNLIHFIKLDGIAEEQVLTQQRGRVERVFPGKTMGYVHFPRDLQERRLLRTSQRVSGHYKRVKAKVITRQFSDSVPEQMLL